MTSPQEVCASSEEKVREIVGLLTKAAKTYQMYLPNNRMFIRSLENLKDALDRFFEENDALTLVVKEFELLHKGKVVYTDSDKHQSLAFRLYRDGIRLITFHQDVTTDELVAFFGALSKALDVDRIEDDLVTLLWEKDLHGITYYEVSDMEPAPTGAEQTTKRSQDFRQLAQTSLSWSRVTKEVERMKPAIALTSQEIREVQELTFAIQDDMFLRKCWQVLSHCLELEPSLDAFRDLENGFIGFINRCLANGQIGLAADTLSRIRIFAESLKDEQASQILDHILASSASEQNLKLIEQVVAGDDEVKHIQCLAYLSRLNRSAIAPILKMFEVCKTPSARQTIIGALASLAADYPQDLLEVADESVETAEAILAVLETIGSEEALLLASRFWDHPAARIRGKVASMLSNVSDPKALEVVVKLTNDPDLAVKRRALVSLVRLSGEEAVQRLITIFTSKDFGRLPHDSKMAMLLAMRGLPPEAQKEIAQTILATRRFFGRREIEDTKLALIQMMHLLDSETALPLLEQVIEKTSGAIRKAAQSCLKRIER